MAGFLARLRRLPRARRREEVERVLREALALLDGERAVASALARLGADGFAVAHYTFDEPDLDDGDAAVQFTYHLAEGASSDTRRDEVRGSGIARIDDDGRVRFEDVDAEIFHLVDDLPGGDSDADHHGGPDP